MHYLNLLLYPIVPRLIAPVLFDMPGLTRVAPRVSSNHPHTSIPRPFCPSALGKGRIHHRSRPSSGSAFCNHWPVQVPMKFCTSKRLRSMHTAVGGGAICYHWQPRLRSSSLEIHRRLLTLLIQRPRMMLQLKHMFSCLVFLCHTMLEVYALHLSRDLAYIVGVAPINSTLCNTFHHTILAGPRDGSSSHRLLAPAAHIAAGFYRIWKGLGSAAEGIYYYWLEARAFHGTLKALHKVLCGPADENHREIPRGTFEQASILPICEKLLSDM
jgi:hypothetical protein